LTEGKFSKVYVQMTFEIGEVIRRHILRHFCAAVNGKGRLFHIALVQGSLEKAVVRVDRVHI